ncbi:MAG: thioesterase, partial [Candidatus Bathyarchaeota archaeon B23]
MEVRTHRRADPRLVGRPIELGEGEAVVELEALEGMAVDDRGLVHGGFTFGLADYAAMLAVNHPHVVLASAEVSFTAPVRVGDQMRARAQVVEERGRRRRVEVEVSVEDHVVLKGVMTCVVLERHVLD